MLLDTSIKNSIECRLKNTCIQIQKFLFFAALPEECQCEKAKSVEEFGNMIQGIIEVLTRNHMKVVFFGRCALTSQIFTESCQKIAGF